MEFSSSSGNRTEQVALTGNNSLAAAAESTYSTIATTFLPAAILGHSKNTTGVTALAAYVYCKLQRFLNLRYCSMGGET
jgi:hypothetical protein